MNERCKSAYSASDQVCFVQMKDTLEATDIQIVSWKRLKIQFVFTIMSERMYFVPKVTYQCPVSLCFIFQNFHIFKTNIVALKYYYHLKIAYCAKLLGCKV